MKTGDMIMNKGSLLVSALVLGLFTTGCASNSSEVASADAAKVAHDKKLTENNDKGLKCTYIKRTGSHRRTKRCVDASTSEQEREAAQDALNRSRARSNIAPPGSNN
jgi:hypothetical protein